MGHAVFCQHRATSYIPADSKLHFNICPATVVCCQSKQVSNSIHHIMSAVACQQYCGLQQTATCMSHTQQHLYDTVHYSLVYNNYTAYCITTVRSTQLSHHGHVSSYIPAASFKLVHCISHMHQHFCFTAYAALDQFSQLSLASAFSPSSHDPSTVSRTSVVHNYIHISSKHSVFCF